MFQMNAHVLATLRLMLSLLMAFTVLMQHFLSPQKKF